jgi:hypothetical protein
MGEHHFFNKLGKSAVETLVWLSAVYGDEIVQNPHCTSGTPNLKTVMNH